MNGHKVEDQFYKKNLLPKEGYVVIIEVIVLHANDMQLKHDAKP